jgi:hypothetical protein
MDCKIILSKFNLASIRTFTYFLYTEFNNAVFILKKQLKINMTGAIGVLESIYVHNAFQCIIGVAPVAILIEKHTLASFTNTYYGASCHGKAHLNSP